MTRSFAGSCPGIGGCSGAAVAVVPDATGNGYWVVTNTGTVYTFGDAANYGQPGTQSSRHHLGRGDARTAAATGSSTPPARSSPSATPPALGSLPPGSAGGLDPASAIFATSDGGGYWVVTAPGKVSNFGDAPDDGDMSGTHLNGPIIAASGS